MTRCHECGKPFARDTTRRGRRADYCSRACGTLARQRRYWLGRLVREGLVKRLDRRAPIGV